jgi:hypothetical protein
MSTIASCGVLWRPAPSTTTSRKRWRPTGSPASTTIVGSRVVIGWFGTKRAMSNQPI